ncbi:MAG TPA: AtpZ/AtpI family protein [Phycisphaerae bacterium]|nr:AtpZ/AtpI family protein [Phycisphaerales bacterium]HRX85302.1 AtpZ/AtpI family protein [Phycisphaerae bacterium]
MPESGKPGRGASSGLSLWRLASLGFDLAAAVGGFTLIGWFADRHWDKYPRFTVIGAVLGLIGGMYNLIRQSLIATRETARGGDDGDSGTGEGRGK